MISEISALDVLRGTKSFEGLTFGHRKIDWIK